MGYRWVSVCGTGDDVPLFFCRCLLFNLFPFRAVIKIIMRFMYIYQYTMSTEQIHLTYIMRHTTGAPKHLALTGNVESFPKNKNKAGKIGRRRV